ncbi:MAG TPA: response regulator [Roseiarcus sp.]|jgi:CheY-like chemotaxis protein|nr:response regulator [Roseiarcus sp.]
MSISKEIAPLLPCLRRFSRALNGSLAKGDAYVIATLESLLRDRSSYARNLPPRQALYQFYLGVSSQPIGDDLVDRGEPSAFDRNLAGLSPQVRQAFLLTTVEGFSEDTAATVMGVDSDRLVDLLAQGARDLAHVLASSILIIEDEPILAMDLESIVEDLGHHVVGVARAHDQAVALAAERQPQLIMADIQLGDGRSGIDAVNEILASASKPVVFITAHPGVYLSARDNRPEPAFLLPKPFKPDSVRAAVSQALFFNRSTRAAA